jgi:hypothetical protein
MASAPAPSHRASLLAGLRTGGVRSNPMTGVPHTAAPGASFNMPSRFASATYNQQSFGEEDDQLSDMLSHNMYITPQQRLYQPPITAAVDGGANRFAHQQGHYTGGMMSGIPHSNPAVGNTQLQAQQQALQMQLMQLELIRMQALQAQQLQAELLAQSQQQSGRSFTSPASAAPTTQSFDLHQTTLNAPLRRPGQGEFRSQPGFPSDDQVPMTAALGGKFGSRPTLPGLVEEDGSLPRGSFNLSSAPATSGGTSLGAHTSNNATNSVPPSKSDTVASWRRGGNNNSVLSGGNRAASINPGLTPSVRVSPPPQEARTSPPAATHTSPARTRPQPLRFTLATSQPLPTVAIDDTDASDTSTESSSKSGSHSSPSTPNSGSSFDRPPLSPREEATKKLYEGLGIGRPSPAITTIPVTVPQRVLSQPVRQPRGPPSGADELGPRNFATRIRRKAIGGLGALMDARERRDVVEAY